jgi:hypothetical protein
VGLFSLHLELTMFRQLYFLSPLLARNSGVLIGCPEVAYSDISDYARSGKRVTDAIRGHREILQETQPARKMPLRLRLCLGE